MASVLRVGLSISVRRASNTNRRNEMLIGVVKLWKLESGYGFVSDEGVRDHFIHVRVVNAAGYADLVAGQRLNFQVGTSPRDHRECVVEIQLLEPILSTPLRPAEDLPPRDEHVTF